MVPSCATAGELKMMSPVTYDHLSDPSRAMAYSRSSCDPISTDPSLAMAGDETIGPPVVKVHQMAGLFAGSVKGERPRWVAPKRNIDWAGSTAYCGSGSAVPFWTTVAAVGWAALSAGQTHRPASQSRFSLQSRSLTQGDGSTCAQAAETTHQPRPMRVMAARGGASQERNVLMMAQG